MAAIESNGVPPPTSPDVPPPSASADVGANEPPTPSSPSPAAPSSILRRPVAVPAPAAAHSTLATPSPTRPDPSPVASTSALSPSASPAPAASPRASPAGSTSTSPTAPKKVVLLRRPSSPPAEPSGPVSPAQASGSDERGGEESLAEQVEQLSIAEENGEKAGDEPPALDPVVLAALSHPRDRFLLLRAEVELERFVSSTSSTRLPLAPPHFPPALNSYQRLLVHRLADTFGITREVEAASSLWNSGPVINPATGQPQGVVVLVKGEATQLPPAKLASYVPAPESTPPAAPAVAPAPISTSTSSSPAPSAASSPAVSVNPALSTTSASPSPATPEPQRVFKILPRSAVSHTTSSASSSIGTDDDASASAGAKGKGRRELTLEEREAAYKEARERIFSQPEPERPAPVASASTASSGASELGMGITRPSSAGSTFSRSSAALSISGARPSPSLASESSSSIRSGYTGYYAAQPPPMQYGVAPGYPNLRSSAPVFDPASGGWTYPQQQVQQQPEYGGYGAQYGAGDYGRTPPGSQPYFPPYPSAAPPQPAYPGQPPIQVTAPSPHSQAASYAYGHSAAAPLQHAPYPPPQSYPQQPPYDPSPTWSQPSHRSMPSPALSASSGASLQQHQQQHQHFPQQAPPAPSGSGSTGSGSGAGYLMRFADGSVVSPGGSITAPATGGSTRSVGSLSSASISSLNSSSMKGNLPRSAAAPGGGRRLSASTTHSIGSVSAISSAALDDSSSPGASRKSPSASASGTSSSAPASDAGSSAGGGEGKRRDRQTTIVGGRPETSAKGKERASGDVEKAGEAEGQPLHPSLPSKPVWVATQPPAARETASSSSSAVAAPQVDSTPVALPPLSFGHQQPSNPQPSFPAYPPPQSNSVLPPPDFFPPPAPSSASAASSAWGARPFPPASYAPPPSDFPALGGGGAAPPAFYPSHPSAAAPPPPPFSAPSAYGAPPPPPAWGPPSSHAAPGPQPTHFHPSIPLQQQQARVFDPREDLMSVPEMRRPPPRSTQLFDPSKPLAAAGRKNGGVVVGSPVAAISRAEKLWNLPEHWINAAITAAGPNGAFQRLERGEMQMEEFYQAFGEELSDVKRGNEAYRRYCQRVGVDCPQLPNEVQIDGKELWSLMMDPATEPDPIVVEAINRLRASRRFNVAALTNNFAPPGHVPMRHKPTPPYTRAISADELREALKETAAEGSGGSKGAGNEVMRALFDEYVESCVEGMRKPDPRFFQLTLDRLGVKAEEAVFLDDIGHNLAAAAKLGINTIRVKHGKSEEAIRELEAVLSMDLGLRAKSKL
ncbi:hypothetical protein JCM6882_001245 [Rhodosporidiobolus microsporus]